MIYQLLVISITNLRTIILKEARSPCPIHKKKKGSWTNAVHFVRSELMFLLYKNPETSYKGCSRTRSRWSTFVKYKIRKPERKPPMTTSSENQETVKKRRPGRPKKVVRRSDLLMVRLTPIERHFIEERAKKVGLKPSEWFRKAAKSTKVSPRFSIGESSWFRVLAGLANNLNQSTHLVHVAGLFSLGLKCQRMLQQIEELLAKINSRDG